MGVGGVSGRSRMVGYLRQVGAAWKPGKVSERGTRKTSSVTLKSGCGSFVKR